MSMQRSYEIGDARMRHDAHRRVLQGFRDEAEAIVVRREHRERIALATVDGLALRGQAGDGVGPWEEVTYTGASFEARWRMPASLAAAARQILGAVRAD